MELLQITDRMFLVPGENGGMFPFSQSVLVEADRRILFDLGLGPRALAAFVKHMQVDIIIVSHAHPDHISGCGHFAGKVPIFVPNESLETFGDLEKLAVRFAVGQEEREIWKQLVTKVMGFTPAAAARPYDGRTAFELGSLKLTAVHTPGHTKDHYCFFEAESGCMLLFDIDLSPGGPWYGNAESSISQYEASLSLVRSFQPAVVVSSHMGILRKNVDKSLEAFQHRFDERDELLLKRMDSPVSPEELAAQFPFTPRHHPALRKLYLYWETEMVRKHMDRLIERGLASPIREKFVRT
jgi:glyoxylase-like metal-dependent hydrolase (beta-lactamase superfamily II)